MKYLLDMSGLLLWLIRGQDSQNIESRIDQCSLLTTTLAEFDNLYTQKRKKNKTLHNLLAGSFTLRPTSDVICLNAIKAASEVEQIKNLTLEQQLCLGAVFNNSSLTLITTNKQLTQLTNKNLCITHPAELTEPDPVTLTKKSTKRKVPSTGSKS